MAHHPFLLPRRPAHLRCPGTTRVSQVPGISLHASHALCGPRQTLRALTLSSALFVLASGSLTPSPSGLWDFRPSLYRGCIKSWGIAVSLAGYVVPCVRLNRFVRLCSLLLNYLPNSCNTRYGWVVSPYPAEPALSVVEGDFHPARNAKFAWRTNDLSHLLRVQRRGTRSQVDSVVRDFLLLVVCSSLLGNRRSKKSRERSITSFASSGVVVPIVTMS